jgi:hypothetical protein
MASRTYPEVEALRAIGEATGVSAFMNTSWGWPAVESAHFFGLAVLLGTLGLFDLRILGVAKSIPTDALHRLVPISIGAFALNAASGLMFLVTMPDQYVYNPSFQIKLVAMIIAGLNVVLFYAVAAKGTLACGSGEDAPWLAKLIAGASLAAWIVVIVCGRLITLWRPPAYLCLWC